MSYYKPGSLLRVTADAVKYTSVVLKNGIILQVKKGGVPGKVFFNSVDDWLGSMSGNPSEESISCEHPTVSNPCTGVKNALSWSKANYALTLRDIAPTYDLMRMFFAHEQYAITESLAYSTKRKDKPTIAGLTTEGHIAPIYYNRILGQFTSRNSNKLVTNLSECGFCEDTPLYRVTGRDTSIGVPYLERIEFPFNKDNYTQLYDGKIALIGAWTHGHPVFGRLNAIAALKNAGYIVFTKWNASHCTLINSSNRHYNKFLTYDVLVLSHVYKNSYWSSDNFKDCIRITRKVRKVDNTIKYKNLDADETTTPEIFKSLLNTIEQESL